MPSRARHRKDAFPKRYLTCRPVGCEAILQPNILPALTHTHTPFFFDFDPNHHLNMTFSINPAFASPVTLLPGSTAVAGRALSTRRPAPVARRGVTSAVLFGKPPTPKSETKKQRVSSFNRSEQNQIDLREAEYRGPQGFTPYAELVNGRLAQMGFVIGLITEIASGKTITQQVGIIFAPVAHLAHSVAVLASTADINNILM